MTSRLSIPVHAGDHVMGPANAAMTLVEYGDYECPQCGLAYPLLKRVQRQVGSRLRLVFRHFPIAAAHPHAQHAAEASEAAAAQGRFWEMHDALFEHQDALDDDSLAGYAADLRLDVDRVVRELAQHVHRSHVRDDFRGGLRSGVNGTPTFFLNGLRYDGDWTDEAAFAVALRES